MTESVDEFQRKRQLGTQTEENERTRRTVEPERQEANQIVKKGEPRSSLVQPTMDHLSKNPLLPADSPQVSSEQPFEQVSSTL